MPQQTYTPIVNQENDFKLVASSRGTEKKIRRLEVRWSGIPLDQRKALCDNEKWTHEEYIPELSKEPRLALSALKKMLERHQDEDKKALLSLEQEMENLIERFESDHEQIESISSDEYWLGLAKCLLVGFEGYCQKNDVKADDLNFKQIQAAYNDFF